MEIFYSEIIPFLAARGAEVTVLTIAHREGLAAEETFAGARVIRTCVDANYLARGTGQGRSLRSIVAFTVSLLKQWKLLRSADAVIFNIWPILPQLVLGRLTSRGTVQWCEVRQGFPWPVINFLVARCAPLHIGMSDAVVNYLRTRHHIAPQNSSAILSGLSFSLYQLDFPRQDKQVLFFGRLSEHKNPHRLLSAFRKNFPPESGYRLVLAGGGDLLESMRREAKGISNIVVTGRISDEEKIRYLRESALLVLPSEREGFPRAIAEAAASGTPTVTVDLPMNGGAAVVRQYGLGWVCPLSEDALAEAVREYADSGTAQWKETSARCVQVARDHFDWEKVTDRLLAFLAR